MDRQKPEYKRAMDILSKIVESRVTGTDDVTKEKFTMLSALFNNFLLLKSKGVKLRDGVAAYGNNYFMRTKSPGSKSEVKRLTATPPMKK
nr:uncharacterized protein LOC109167327 [Ipomoea batatas]